MPTTRTRLKELAHELGLESRRLALLGEGNVSALGDGGTFFVKASGSSLGSLEEDQISHVKLDYLTALLERDSLTDDEVSEALEGALTNPGQPRPSVETFMHAVCLTEGGASWVGHTHPLSVNSILCSDLGSEPFERHVFPDAIVVCGLHPLAVPYVDPGFELGKAVLAGLRRHRAEHGKIPKLILLENHGMVALGQSPVEVRNIHLMADKWASVLLATLAIGRPRPLSDAHASRIDGRSDEAHRRDQLLRLKFSRGTGG